jgi:DNA-binding NarL/FixJ family response regulator
VTGVAVVAAVPAIRAALEAIVARTESLSVTTAAASVEALASDPNRAPSEAVVLHVTTADGAARDLRALPPIPVVVLLGGRAWPAAIPAMIAAGARGVLPDDATAEEIAAAVEAAVAGLVVVPAELASALAASRQPATSEPRDLGGARAARLPALTPREREILSMLAEGLPNKVIASRLGISEHTVKTHLEAVFEKLGASTRAEAVARAVRSGLLLL